MKDTKQIIRELVEEVLEEMTGTGAVAGYQTKFAFGKGDRTKKIAGKSMPGGTVVGKKEGDDTSVEESDKKEENEALPMVRRGAKIMEESKEHEMCSACGDPTGKAGKGDDSHYDSEGHGPFCDDCWEKHLEKQQETPINEARSRYRNFKESDMMKNHAKISYGIREAKKMLGEVEYLVGICERLKTECGFNTDNLWARTRPDMNEIHNRLKEIAKRINRMGKQ